MLACFRRLLVRHPLSKLPALGLLSMAASATAERDTGDDISLFFPSPAFVVWAAMAGGPNAQRPHRNRVSQPGRGLWRTVGITEGSMGATAEAVRRGPTWVPSAFQDCAPVLGTNYVD